MPYADIIIIAIFVIFLIKGWLKGFFLEFFTFVGLIVAAFVSYWVYKTYAPELAEGIGAHQNLIKGAVFIACFIIIAFVFGAAGHLLN